MPQLGGQVLSQRPGGAQNTAPAPPKKQQTKSSKTVKKIAESKEALQSLLAAHYAQQGRKKNFRKAFGEFASRPFLTLHSFEDWQKIARAAGDKTASEKKPKYEQKAEIIENAKKKPYNPLARAKGNAAIASVVSWLTQQDATTLKKVAQQLKRQITQDQKPVS